MQARNILIAVGGRAIVPPIEGKEHTIISDQVLDLPKKPSRYAAAACINKHTVQIERDNADNLSQRRLLLCQQSAEAELDSACKAHTCCQTKRCSKMTAAQGVHVASLSLTASVIQNGFCLVLRRLTRRMSQARLRPICISYTPGVKSVVCCRCRLAIVGGGYLAAEPACIQNNLGADVHMFYRGKHMLSGKHAAQTRDALMVGHCQQSSV